jgi:methionyl aminopeptidase
MWFDKKKEERMGLQKEYIEAGRITREVRKWLMSYVKPGIKSIELCEAVEKKIEYYGGKPAFPCGIGINHVTAHYSPRKDDISIITENDLVKIDFGVHVNGYIADTAVTVTFSERYTSLLEATQKALEESINTAKRDQRAGEIGRTISNVASRYGFRVIENLSGHTLERYTVHAGKSIPNVYVPNLPVLRKDEVFAIEPFFTTKDGSGYVIEYSETTIFSIVARKRTKDRKLDSLIDTIWNERKTLPFSPRWFEKKFEGELTKMLNELMRLKIVRSYPTLIEGAGKPVAQFEHTLAFQDGSLVVLT